MYLANKHFSGLKLYISLTISYYFGCSRPLYMDVVFKKEKYKCNKNIGGLMKSKRGSWRKAQCLLVPSLSPSPSCPILKAFGTERARLGTFRGFGTERARLGPFRGLGTERARLGTLKKKKKSLKKKYFLLEKSTYQNLTPI